MPLALEDASRGAELYFQQCEHCHTLNIGGPHVFGPNLYSIFGQVSGQIPGSKASQIYKDKAINWTPGTMKPYKGLADKKDRNDLIAYLETQTDNKPKKWFGVL